MELSAILRAGRLPRHRLIGTLMSALALGLALPGYAAVKSWNAGAGNWDNAANWTPVGVPANNDDILIGNLPGVQNSTIMLTAPGSGYESLHISNGMVLDLNHNELVSFGHAWIVDPGSRIIARNAAGGPNLHDFQGTLHVGTGAHFELEGNVSVRVFNDSNSDGTISGRGTFLVSSPTPFRNDGVIQPDNNGGMVVQQGHEGDGVIDIDGISGDGHLQLDTAFSVLEIIADSLQDGFSGTLTMAPGAYLNMNTTQDWAATLGSEINVQGTNDPNAASLIGGSDFHFNGSLNVNSLQAHLRVLSDMTFGPSSSTTVGFTDWLELDGATTVNGGQFLMGNQGIIDFDGQTTIQAGTFTTNSADPANGAIALNGPTTWSGGATINGVVRQFGNAFVAGPSVVNGGVLDMDGNGNTGWTIWNDFVVNADAVQSEGTVDFTGTMTIASADGKLTVLLPAADSLFEMAGEMNLIGHPGIFKTRYDGTALDLQGDLNIANKVATDGYLRAFSGTIDLPDPDDILRLDGGGLINSACTFVGTGELRIGAGSDPLFTNANLDAVGLVNQGHLRFQSMLMADRFVNEAGSEWEASLKGYEQGVDYDHFVIANDAALGGDLSVTLQNDFLPLQSDTFTILNAASLSAEFDNVLSGGRVFTNGGEGSFLVTYDGVSNRVVLSDFLTCPADLDLNGAVDVLDLLILLGAWGTPDANLDGDLITNINDLLYMLSVWGPCP